MDFKDRLYKEEAELSEKFGKLKKAIDEGLLEKVDPNQAPLLCIQLSAMALYLDALQGRIRLLDYSEKA